jgi:hypothetical protein
MDRSLYWLYYVYKNTKNPIQRDRVKRAIERLENDQKILKEGKK